MLSKKFCALLLSLFLLVSCAPSEPAESPAPSPSSQSGVGEEAPEEEPAAPSSSSEAQPEEESQVSSTPEESVPQMEEALSWEELSEEELQTLDRNRQALTDYLEEALGPEKYTYFFYTHDQMGLGIATPDLQAARDAVAAYNGPQMRVEYLETANSRARLDAAYEEYRAMADPLCGTSREIVANISSGGEGDGYIHIAIHQMNPELQEFLDTSEYGDCFLVEVTGADSPIINPDT
jgi:ABC-type phosphate/phosphonate transport system substrate-binding protein